MEHPEAEHVRLLEMLERILQLPESDMKAALSGAADLVAAALSADKVDAFMFDPSRSSLIALGASAQPLSQLQRAQGLDVLALANGGRVVEAFHRATAFACGRLREDPEELRGLREVLQVQSMINAPIKVADSVRGVLSVTSREPDKWGLRDVHFTDAVARWVGVLVHRVELVAEMNRSAVEQGRRAAAEELVTVLAHDLRHYLTPIGLRARQLLRRAERDVRDADVRDLKRVLQALARVSDLTSDLLDVARIDHGLLLLNAKHVDLVALLRELAEALSSPEAPIDVQTPEALGAVVDAARIRQCVENLLTNARMHSPPGIPVILSAAEEMRGEERWARIDVKDRGPGIPEDVLPHIFDRFTKGTRSTGLGLGLYLAKQIAALHDGALTVAPEATGGTRFTLTLPAAPRA